MRGEKRVARGENKGEQLEPETLDNVIETVQSANESSELPVAKLTIELTSTCKKEAFLAHNFELLPEISKCNTVNILGYLQNKPLVEYLGLQRPEELSFLFYIKFKRTSDVSKLTSLFPHPTIKRFVNYNVFAYYHENLK